MPKLIELLTVQSGFNAIIALGQEPQFHVVKNHDKIIVQSASSKIVLTAEFGHVHILVINVLSIVQSAFNLCNLFEFNQLYVLLKDVNVIIFQLL